MNILFIVKLRSFMLNKWSYVPHVESFLPSWIDGQNTLEDRLSLSQ